MSDYKQKYLKYKNKYLELKTKIDAQRGGNYFTQGTYVFFLSNNQKAPEQKVIADFDKLTTEFGNCALYLRIGATGWNDFTSSYNTIYPNRGVTEIVGTTATEAWDATSKGASQAWDATSKAASQAWDAAFKKPETVGKSMMGGENCTYKPMKISELNTKNIECFTYIDNLSPEAIKELVTNINKNVNDPITTILVVMKLGNLTFDAEIIKRFRIDYNGNVITNVQEF